MPGKYSRNSGKGAIHPKLAALKNVDIPHFLARLNKLLSTPAGIDRTLGLIYYLSLLLAPQLTRLSKATSTKLPSRHRHLPITPTSTALATASARLGTLSSRISDVRMFLRLWGLIGIYHWGVSTWNTPKDPVARAIELAQVAVNTGFQVSENIAYLSKHKLVDITPRTETNLWLWSSRCWAAHIALDFVRIERARQLRKGGNKKEKEVWKKQTLCNAAQAPLAAHWSTESGLIGKTTIGALGSFAAVWSFVDTWRAVEV